MVVPVPTITAPEAVAASQMALYGGGMGNVLDCQQVDSHSVRQMVETASARPLLHAVLARRSPVEMRENL